jgi:hypothetical protein
MKPMKLICALVLTNMCAMPALGQNTESQSAVVPRLVNFSGRTADADGKVITGIAGVTFAIYSEQTGGSPLWLETQNVRADSKGH